jgi:hypothetical protein
MFERFLLWIIFANFVNFYGSFEKTDKKHPFYKIFTFIFLKKAKIRVIGMLIPNYRY